MYIRIGNDISLQLSPSSIGVDDINNVIYAKGKFIALDQEKIEHEHHCCCPQFYDSEYTIHDCGMLSYNVMPFNTDVKHKHQHNHGFCVYEDCSSPARTNETKDSIILQFPGKHQKYCGRYRVELEVILENDESKTMLIDFGEQFTLVGDEQGETGDIHIQIGEKPSQSFDIYTMSATVEYLQNLQNNLVTLMLNSDKYEYATLPKKQITVHINNNGERIVIMSKYDNLYFMYNTFCFPVSRTKVGDYWLYISSYSYNKQDVLLQVSKVDGINYPELDFSLDVNPITPPIDYSIITDVAICPTGPAESNPDLDTIDTMLAIGDNMQFYASATSDNLEQLLSAGPLIIEIATGQKYKPISVSKYGNIIYNFNYGQQFKESQYDVYYGSGNLEGHYGFVKSFNVISEQEPENPVDPSPEEPTEESSIKNGILTIINSSISNEQLITQGILSNNRLSISIMTTTGKINIAGALHSIDNTGIVVYTGDVYDPIIYKNQQQINYDYDQQISQCSSAIEQQQTINDTQAIINEQQIEINNQQDQKIKHLETKIDNIESGGGTITPSNSIKYEVMTEEEYNNLSEIKADTFYFTYLEEESSPEEP